MATGTFLLQVPGKNKLFTELLLALSLERPVRRLILLASSRNSRFFLGGGCASRLASFIRARRVVQPALEFLDHPRQMPMHRKTRSRGVVRRDGANDRRVVANRLLGEVRRCESAFASVPTVRHAGSTSPRRRAPASRCRWPWPSANEIRGRCPRESTKSSICSVMRIDALLQCVDVVSVGICSGQRRDLALDQLARVEQFERARARIARRTSGRCLASRKCRCRPVPRPGRRSPAK